MPRPRPIHLNQYLNGRKQKRLHTYEIGMVEQAKSQVRVTNELCLNREIMRLNNEITVVLRYQYRYKEGVTSAYKAVFNSHNGVRTKYKINTAKLCNAVDNLRPTIQCRSMEEMLYGVQLGVGYYYDRAHHPLITKVIEGLNNYSLNW
jgi:hypothetical protein